MPLRITKAGLLDTVQDAGRFGYRHLGIGVGGAMDRFSAALANALLGNEPSAAVLELHYPAAQLRFESACLVCLTGADFSPEADGRLLPLNRPLLLAANTELRFVRRKSGSRCYLGVYGGLQLTPWLGGYSTNLLAGAGGFKGRKLQSGDMLELPPFSSPSSSNNFQPLPWHYAAEKEADDCLRFIEGAEWDWLTPESKERFLQSVFRVAPESNRMGYRLQGPPLQALHGEQLVSSAVSFGTVQLLPSGQVVVLGADHQTTGGYPRLATVATASLPLLAQKGPGEELRFAPISIDEAEQNLTEQTAFLRRLQNTCNLRLQNWLHAH